MSKDKVPSTGTKDQNKARETYNEAVYLAFRVCRETIEQADIAHKKALEQAIDKQAKEEAEKTYKEALEQAKKVRDEIWDEVHKAFTAVWEQSDDSENSKGENS